MLTLTLLFFIAGLILGSFLLVVADRSGKKISFLTGRSKCEACNHVLSWYELIPLLSFVMQRGKCGHCKARLSFWYPLSELFTGFVLAIVFLMTYTFGLPIVLLYEVIALCLVAICFADIKHEIIPLPLVIISCLSAAVLIYVTAPVTMSNHLLSATGAGLFFLLIFLVTKGRGMGFGDVIYSVFMGFLLGFPSILFGLYLSFIIGAFISLVLIALKKKKLHGGTIPFGPFLVLGTFIMMVWGKEVIQLFTAYFA